MGVFTHIVADYTSPVAPARFFQAFCVDNHNFMPKVLPEIIKNVDILEGESGKVGSVKQVNFCEGRPFKYAKNRVDEIDASKYYIKYTTVEGDVLGETLEYAVYKIKLEAVGDRTRYTMVAHYHTKGDHVVNDEELGFAKASIKNNFDAAEKFLISNPQLYA